MKIVAVLVSLFMIASISNVAACPTCIARVTPESPEFFSDDFYQAHQDTSSSGTHIDATDIQVVQDPMHQDKQATNQEQQ